MLTLQERANLQLKLNSLKELYSKKEDEFKNSKEYTTTNFIDKMFLIDEFKENNFSLLNEIKSIENKLSDFMNDVNNQDEEGCLNCGS